MQAVTEQLNAPFLDLYGDTFKEYILLHETASFEDITAEVDKKATIGGEHIFKIGNRFVKAFRKFTWKGNVAKTRYMHIQWVVSPQNQKVLQHWKENKSGKFDLIFTEGQKTIQSLCK